MSGTDGTTLQSNLPASTNYAAPTTITTQTYGETIGYNSWLGVTQTTGLNGEQLYLTYDWIGRPTTATSPYGATTNYAYAAAVPLWQTKTGPDGFTRTTLDGLGRAIRVERGPDSLHIQSVVDTVYAPCACSPLGKVQKVSMPYQPGAATINWTVYRYDGIGRTVSVTQPDGASTTTYVYSGNQTTVTDPAGKWKTFTTDVQGNLTTVTEPDPSSATGGTLTTSYTYDWMNHLTGVSMPRGGITQTRSFVYNDAGQLISATNPESGTVTYTYNADNTLNYKHDAKGQDTVYTYDTKKRVTMIQRYPRGKTAPEDTSQRVTYQYDTNTLAPDFALYLTGRLATAQYTIVDENGSPSPVTEMYAYHPAGAVTAKRLTAMGCGTDPDQQVYGCSPAYVEADYTYNSGGQVATYGMARNSSSTLPTDPTYTYAYDAMGRPTTLTDDQSGLSGGGTPNTVWAKNAQYDFAGRMTSLQTYGGIYYTGTYQPAYETETSTWNVNGQLASRGWSSSNYTAPVSGTVQYTYSATQNNGQITQASDSLSGETISYQYDSLKRLVSAASTPSTGTTPAAWTQTFQYDGFGNLTAKVLNGGTTAIPVNGSTNRLANAVYDANGNMTSGAGVMPGYDVANRMTSAQLVSGGTEYYGYAPDNKRIYRRKPAGGYTGTEWTFYGAYGEKLGVFNLGGSPFGASFQVVRTSVWFAGRLVAEDATNPFASGLSAVRRDRLGSNRAGGARFYPYGEEIGTKTVDDRTKFATYTRDGTGLDYADQRFYASSYGRFNTPDPTRMNIKTGSPASWNAFAYVEGDPVDSNDPTGRFVYGPGPDYCAMYPDDIGCSFCQDDPFGCSNDPGPGPGSGGGGGTRSGFADDPAISGVGSILTNNLKCDQLLFGQSATTKGSADRFATIRVLPSSELPTGAPPLGTAMVIGTQAQWGSTEPWAEMNGGNIYLNDLYFPNDTAANIGTPWGATLSAVTVFNHDHNRSLTGLQVEETIILHELWHIKGSDSEVHGPNALANLISTCIN